MKRNVSYKRIIKDATKMLQKNKLPNEVRENLFNVINQAKGRMGWR
jgi:hypothetical protein